MTAERELLLREYWAVRQAGIPFEDSPAEVLTPLGYPKQKRLPGFRERRIITVNINHSLVLVRINPDASRGSGW